MMDFDINRQITFIVDGEYTKTGCYEANSIIDLFINSYGIDELRRVKNDFAECLDSEMTFSRMKYLFNSYLSGWIREDIKHLKSKEK